MRKSNHKKETDFNTIRWLFARTEGQRLRILLLVVFNAIEALIAIRFALVCRNLVDSAVAFDWNQMILYALLLLALMIGEVALGLLSQAVSEYLHAKLRITLQTHIMQTLLNKEYAGISHYHSGEMLNRMFSDVGVVTKGMVNILPSIIYMLFRLVGAAIVLIVLAPGFTLLFLVIGVLLCLVMTLLRSRLKFLHKRMQEAEGQVRSFMQEALSSILIIKVFGAKKQIEHRADSFQHDYFAARMKRRFVSMISGAGLSFVFEIGYFSAMLWGCIGIFHGTMTYGTLTAMLQLVSQIQSPFAGFSSLISQFYAVLASSERIMELEALPDEEPVVAQDRDTQYEDFEGIRLSHVDFTYGRTPVLQDVDMYIHKGDFVSLTGISGGGKSTLFLLMLGAYHPSEGELIFCYRVDPLQRKPGLDTRSLFAYVPQGNYLFSGTLRENISFFQENICDDDIWSALKIACAETFVQELPLKLDTPLGEKGHGLSEGQMQRIAIARAILSGAPILLLDEATSALDEETEAQLLQNIASLKNRTCLIVTHRPAALSICNRHFGMKDGHITEIA